MFNICSHIRGNAHPAHHVLTFSREQLQPGICKMAVQHVFGVIVSVPERPTAKCRKMFAHKQKINSLWTFEETVEVSLGRADAGSGVFLPLSLPTR